MIPTTIIINNFDIATSSFTGGFFSLDPMLMSGIVTGTIGEDCTGLISVSSLENNIYFTFDSENVLLDLDGFGIFIGNIQPWSP